jgi:hypothetical protein
VAQVRDQHILLYAVHALVPLSPLPLHKPSRHHRAMSDVAQSSPLPATSSPKQPETLKVTGKVRVAVEAMVWQGLPRSEAAKTAGMTEHGLYKALVKPPVKAFYMAQLDVLRTSERARNIHALVGVRDSATNQMATVAAVNALEKLDNQAPAGSVGHSPGVVIQILGGASLMAHERGFDPKPLILHEPVQSDDT